MRKSLEIRQALGRAVDDMAKHAEKGGAEYETAKRLKAELEGELARALEVEAAQRGSAVPTNGNGSQPIDIDATLSRSLAPYEAFAYSPHSRGVDPSLAARFDFNVRAARKELGMQIEPTKHFRSLGEQLQAVYNFYTTRGSNCDGRLTRAPSGASEIDPTGGGFLIQVDFANAIFMLAHDMGEILGRVNKIPIGANSNGLKIPGVDETSRATGSRWGGVQSYWVAEGTSVTNTKPKFRLIEFDLRKLMSVMYTTEEMLMDSTALTRIAGQAFSEEIMFMTEDAVFEGTGAGQPLGIINSPSLVSVAKQAGQAAGTIVKENIDNMWSRMWIRSRKNAVWFINQDCEPQLNQMGQVVGTGGLPVYLPPGGLSAAPFGLLYARPVIPTEYSAALGAPGDIVLADLSQYTLVDKGGVNAATSMHVAFLTDEMVFRITYRVDGRPMWSTVLTPFKGSLTKSPFVAIAQR